MDLHPTPFALHATQTSLGQGLVETVQDGSRQEPTYRIPRLYTSTSAATSGPRLPREPEEFLVESPAQGVVIAVVDRLPLLGAPSGYHVHRGGFYLRQVRFGGRNTVGITRRLGLISRTPCTIRRIFDSSAIGSSLIVKTRRLEMNRRYAPKNPVM